MLTPSPRPIWRCKSSHTAYCSLWLSQPLISSTANLGASVALPQLPCCLSSSKLVGWHTKGICNAIQLNRWDGMAPSKADTPAAGENTRCEECNEQTAALHEAGCVTAGKLDQIVADRWWTATKQVIISLLSAVACHPARDRCLPVTYMTYKTRPA